MNLPDWMSEIHFAFSRREHGQMSFRAAPPEVVASNRRNFLSAHNLALESVVAGELAHGPRVAVVTGKEAGRGALAPDWIPEVDGLVTTEPDLLLLTTHADCAPLVIYDPTSRVLGQAHAGWRGLASGIVEELVRKMLSLNGNHPERLKAWIGPTVRPCCYTVGMDVAQWFPEECRVLVGESIRLNLPRFIALELERLQLDAENVTDSLTCTSCDPRFSSFRRDGPEVAAMALVTGLRRDGRLSRSSAAKSR